MRCYFNRRRCLISIFLFDVKKKKLMIPVNTLIDKDCEWGTIKFKLKNMT